MRQPARRVRRGPGWGETSLFPGHEGFVWWSAVLLAVTFALVGAAIDMLRMDRLGVPFQGFYFVGCLLAVILVQRKALFGPMVAPPLILAIVVPVVMLLAGTASAGGLAGVALAVLTPLINGFPTMAVTTLLTLALGAFRVVTQRRPRNEPRQPEARPAQPSPVAGGPAPHPRPQPVSRPRR